MLHCNMIPSTSLLLGLEDLLAELRHAHRCGDLGRLALIAYCDVRRWARLAGEPELARVAEAMFTGEPHVSREAFLAQIDALMLDLGQLHQRLSREPWAQPLVTRSPWSQQERPASV